MEKMTNTSVDNISIFGGARCAASINNLPMIACCLRDTYDQTTRSGVWTTKQPSRVSTTREHQRGTARVYHHCNPATGDGTNTQAASRQMKKLSRIRLSTVRDGQNTQQSSHPTAVDKLLKLRCTFKVELSLQENRRHWLSLFDQHFTVL